MGYTVDIDTGGTFTDGLFSDGTTTRRAKVDSTPHDLTISWFNCLSAGAHKFGFSKLRDFLDQVDIIRWSSTVATNVVAEHKGPKLGLFVTDGYQETLYSGHSSNPAFGSVIERADVEGVKQPTDMEDLLLRLKGLLEKGVRRICISLRNSFTNNEDEQKIKAAFEEQYPDHYLGSVPLLLGSDICKHPDDMSRTHIALLNAYVHAPMAQSMFNAEDKLIEQGYAKPLLLGRIDGGVSRVAKTKPVDTIESGPIFGVHAAVYFANVYQLPHVITLDVGGTTSKIGLVEAFQPAVVREPHIFGIPLKQAMLDLSSIALGGGTVAKVAGERLQLGPQSMGAYPGPACYDLGGSEPTLTDAYLVEEFLDPAHFAGGTKKLDRERAEKIIEEKIAAPLGVDLHLAGFHIASEATRMIAEEVGKLIGRTGRPPHEFVLFAFGGNGGIVGCEVAKKVGIEKAYLFSLGSVFSAFGSSVADVSHSYEYAPFVVAKEQSLLAVIIGWMQDEARRDMEGEGFDLSTVEANLEISCIDRDKPEDVLSLACPWTLQRLADEVMIDECLKKFPGDVAKEELVIELVKLSVRTPVAKIQLTHFDKEGENPVAAFRGERQVWRGTEGVISSIYEWDKLKAGNIIAGHAIIEGADTTYIVPRGWELVMDSFGNGIVSRRQ